MRWPGWWNERDVVSTTTERERGLFGETRPWFFVRWLHAARDFVQRVLMVWRRKRAARRDLEWARWLESADSCEVRPRKWTK